MIHTAPQAAAFAAHISPASHKISATPLLPMSRAVAPIAPAMRAKRPAMLTRRYETCWLSSDGLIETATRLAPAIPAFEEAFSAVARGTLIETTKGLVAVEDLDPGMLALTAEGRIEPITWIGSMTLFPPHAIAGLAPSTLTRITADAFGAGRPMPDLVLGQQARLLLRGGRCLAAGHATAYAPARNMIDGESIVEVTPVAPVAMYHIVLARHGSLRCAGIEVESFHPGKDYAERLDPQLAALFIAMFPHLSGFGDFGPLAHPRLSSDETDMMIAA